MNPVMSSIRIIVCCCALTLAACGGKGVDARLDTASEELYRISLAKAFQEMTPKQQEGFNWAVSNYNLYDFFAKYPNATPRKVINDELDSYELRMSKELERLKAAMITDSGKLKSQDAQLAEAMKEAAKIEATGVRLTKDWADNTHFTFATKNGSRFNVSQAYWTMHIFLNGHEKPDYSCGFRAYYSSRGGLASGKVVNYEHDVFSDCSELDNLDVKQAARRDFKLEIDPENILDYSEKSILPKFEVTTADYEKAIAKKNEGIEGAKSFRSELQ